MTSAGILRSPGRLRWLTIAIVALAVTPIFTLYLSRLQAESEVALADARDRAFSLARSGAAKHNELVTNARGLAEALRHIPAVDRQTPECADRLIEINAAAGWAASLFVLGPDGMSRCSSRAGTRGVDFSDRPYFREALATGKFLVSDAIIGRVTKHPVVAAALPLRDANGAIDSVLVVGAELAWLTEIAEIARSRHAGSVLAINSQDALISRQPRGTQLMKVEETDSETRALIRKLLTTEDGIHEVETPDQLQIFGVARTADSRLVIAVGFDRDEVLGPITQRFRKDLLWLLAISLGSALLALALAEFSVLRGVKILNTAALKLKAGKVGVRVDLPRTVAAELQNLGVSFNSMIAEFERLAYLDRLTGLPNRRYLERRLLQREPSPPGGLRDAVLAIDLDGFKPVNDVHGHAVGDRVLAAVAKRIATVAEGRALIARLGGDEFVAVLQVAPGQPGREAARRFAEEIRRTLQAPVDIDSLRFPLGASVGIALLPEDADTLAGALIAADAALYEAKRLGRNRVMDHAPSVVPGHIDGDLIEGFWTTLDLVGKNHR
jgi:diguanylate cyclase (GGDEF)-like protein